MPSVEDHPEPPPFPDELEAPIPGEPADEHKFEEMARSRIAARFHTLWEDLPEDVRSHAYEDELVRVKQEAADRTRCQPKLTGFAAEVAEKIRQAEQEAHARADALAAAGASEEVVRLIRPVDAISIMEAEEQDARNRPLGQALYRVLYDNGVSFESNVIIPKLIAAVRHHMAMEEQAKARIRRHTDPVPRAYDILPVNEQSSRYDRVLTDAIFRGKPEICGDYPAPCNHDPAHERPDHER